MDSTYRESRLNEAARRRTLRLSGGIHLPALKINSAPYSEEHNAFIRLLADIPRPRPLRMSFKGGLTALLTFPGPLILLALFANDERHHPTPGITIARLVNILLRYRGTAGRFALVVTVPKAQASDINGDLAIGHVTEAYHDGGVRYAFETPSGERLTKLGQTYRTDLSRGMRVLVFYDPQKPKREIGLVASFYEVQLPQDNSRPALEALLMAVAMLAIVSPLILFFRHLGRSDLTYPAILVTVTLTFAFHEAGRMRRDWWFWATMAPGEAIESQNADFCGDVSGPYFSYFRFD